MNEQHRIIQDAMKKWAPFARIVEIEERPIKPGFQSVELFRHKIAVIERGIEKEVFLVTKKASLHERRTLSLLCSQSAKVPFHYSDDPEPDSPSFVCMQDIDHNTDYTKLDLHVIEQHKIPKALAHIHASNYRRSEELSWLSFADRRYITGMLQERWKPQWEKALKDGQFREKFRAYIPDVQAAAATIIDDMEHVLNDEFSHTLIHTDLHPGNILSTNDNEVFFIDWEEARYGTFYLDIPLPFRDRHSAENYHQLLAASNIDIPLAHYIRQYRTASRYIGLRYMAWTLWDWKESPSTLQSLNNYLGMVVG
ncbi:phosphotransferase [Paenibacillus thermotolerans]|uniref:phosphotransferase n=1 Tax=Paenibacillus thermotolerans TaxID=3027807 RepID=UPI002367CEAA|nr:MULTISPECIES: phosphotransferase [unclassified Paenibacillus]